MAALRDATIDELDALHRELEQQRREVIRHNAPADQVASVEMQITKVINEFRRRGL